MNGSTSTPPPTSSTTALNSDKLSGQLIIKAQLGDDIRKMMIHNEDLTLNELVLMMERIFAGKISNSDELTIKYLDDDGDKVTLLNDSDLTVALHFHKLLRLFVLVNGKEQFDDNSLGNQSKDGSFIDAKTFRNELQQIRNSVQTILDRLQLPTNQETTLNQQKDSTTTTTPPSSSSTAATATNAAVISNTAREFDPYKHLQQSQRSTTPDSIRSKSSNSNRTFGSEQKAFQPPPSSSSSTTAMVPPPPPTSLPTTVDNQQSYQSSDSNDPNKQPSSTYPQMQMPTPHFVPTGYGDQQTKSSPFVPQPGSFPGMPPLPNTNNTSRFISPYPSSIPTPTPPPASSTNQGQPSTFIGQQQTPTGPPPTQGGFYGQQQALMQQRSGYSAFNNTNNTNPTNTFGQQQTSTPPTSSSPATINPSYVQPTAMPAPPPMASQQPYGGYPPQTNFFNPAQQFTKTT